MSKQPVYKYKRTTAIKTQDREHPVLLAYSRMVDRLHRLCDAGRLKQDGAGAYWFRVTDPQTGKSVQVHDQVHFYGDEIFYNVSITFYQFQP